MPHDAADTCDVAIVGGGPAGLSLAHDLRGLGIDRVVVLERDQTAGGVPRHCGHYPFGFHEFRRPMTGPEYSSRKIAKTLGAGVDIRTGTTVTELGVNACLTLSTADGVSTLAARRVVLCTGTREASRAQRFISGARPQGVITTGALQAFVYLEGLIPFRRPVILGTELVSFSALLTCRHAGIRPVAMVEENTRVTARAFSRGLPALLNIPVHLGTRLRRVIGERALEAVELETATGKRRIIKADGVICTGQFRPEAALLRTSHLALDPATAGPQIDQYFRASDPVYYCAGNLLRPVETHAWCASEGAAAARLIAAGLGADTRSDTGRDTPLRAAHPAIRYVVPQRLSAEDRPGAMEHVQLRLTRPAKGRLVFRADGREICSRPVNSLPERRILMPIAPLLAHRGASSIDLDLKENG